MRSDLSKIGLSIAALGPKITLCGALIGFLAGGSVGNIVGATAGAVTGSIVGGVIGGVCILIGISLMAYEGYLNYKEEQELEKRRNNISPSTRLINDVTFENRVESKPIIANDNRIEAHQISSNVTHAKQQEPSWYDEYIAPFFSSESKPKIVHATNTSNINYRK